MVFDRKPTSILPLFQSYSTVRGYGSWTEATKDGTVRSWDTIVRFTGAKRVGAGDGIRTRDINLGKVALYQLSYSRARRIATIVSLREAIVKCGN
jgi:hypothetical protein